MVSSETRSRKHLNLSMSSMVDFIGKNRSRLTSPESPELVHVQLLITFSFAVQLLFFLRRNNKLDLLIICDTRFKEKRQKQKKIGHTKCGLHNLPFKFYYDYFI